MKAKDSFRPIVEAYENSGKSFDKLVEEKTKKLCRENPNAKNMSEEELAYLADVEVIADSCETMLKNSKIFEDIAQGNLTLAQKIKDKLKNFIARLKQLLNKTNALTHEGKLLEECVTEFENINRIWDKAVTDGIKTANAMHAERKNNTADNSDVKNQSRNIVQSEFEKNVDAIEKNTYNSNNIVIMGVTPDVLQKIGLTPLPLAMTKNHIYSIAVSEARAKKEGRYRKNTNYHALGFNTVKDIYDKISNPLMVIAHPDFTNKVSRDSTHKVIVLVDLSVNGEQIIAPIEMDFNAKYNNNFIDVNLVSTYFNKKNIGDLIKEAVALETNNRTGFFYVDKKRTQSIFEKSGYQLPRILNNSSSNIIIRKIDDNVNKKINKITQSQQFIRWFGDWQNHPESASKVVDKNGEPLVVYHGTLTQGIHEFKKEYIGSRYSFDEVGFFFTDRKSIAEDYASSEFGSTKKGDVIPVYLNMRNPLYFDKSYAIKNGYGNVFRENDSIGVWDAYQGAILDEVAEKSRCDGVIIDDGTSKMLVVFEPNQIKSATDNIGTFDGNNPDIRYQSRTADIDNAYLEAVNNNDMETAQRLVDEAAERAFAESKIRDEDGKLLKVYHGTPKDFTVFRNSGSGMYFTADPDYARGYTQLNGKVLKTFLNIKKPFDILNDSIARKIFIDEFIKGGYAQGIHPSSTLTEINKYIQNGVDYIKNTLRFKDLEKKINNDTATEAEEQEYYDLDDAITKYETENKLSDYMKHPELFKAYPQLKDLKIYFRQSVNKGEYNSSTKTIIINPMNSAKVQREALIHEIQHAIQDIEGFAKGSSVGYWQKEGYSFNDSYDRYQRTAGEIESRDTAHRIDYADEERKSIQPDIYRTDAVLKEDSIKYSQRYYKQGNDFSKALSRKEWASFYSSLKKSNQRDAFRIGDNGILIPDKDNSNYKLVCYEDDSENLYITAVYKLENYDYNIHDGGLNIAQTIIDRKKAGLNEKHTKAILQSYSALSGAIFREYNGKTGRFIKLTRSGNKTVQYSGDESDRAGISENAGQGISESGVEDDFPQFQMRPDGGYSNRQLLAEALESSTQNNVTFHTEGVD